VKIKYLFLSIILLITLSFPILGQDIHADITKTDAKNSDMSIMMGKPVVEETVNGYHMKVWFMTQGQHKKMMGEGRSGKDTSRIMTKAMTDPMMNGTHHIMLEVKEVASGKDIDNATAQVIIISPAKTNTSVDLKPMMHHFGAPITLVKGGKYQFKVTVNVGEVARSIKFEYVVQ
jgi:hypothetical protein